MKRESFRSRLGFLLVSAGCAIGIGNVWRFPYVTGKNGGGYFVLFYILCLLIMGVPVLTMELAVGRAEDAQCVVILGAGVNGTTPSLMLSSRLQTALDFIADKPDIPIICSGGQGPGEDISEADCMADWLIAHGVDESRIYREDRSTSTQENFAYSEEIMAELGLDAGDMFAFVTNDYHIFRAGRIAGTDAACGVAATLPRSAYYDALQLNYYVREAFATGWLLLRGN